MIQERIVLITGANSGLGKGAAMSLAKEGHTILMLSRSKPKAQEAQAEIIERSGNNRVEVYIADLEDLASILRAVEEIKKHHSRIDILINNAGVILVSKELTAYNVEKTLAVNHLGHFLLTYLLLELLRKSTEPQIINVSSQAHRAGTLDIDDINYEHKPYSISRSYGRSKLANLLFTYKLSRELNSISINALHPGFVGSNFAKNNGWYANLAMIVLRPLARSIHRAAKIIDFLAGPMAPRDSGKYYVDKTLFPLFSPKIRSVSSSKASYDLDLQDQLWDWSVQTINTTLTELNIPRDWS